MDIHLKVEKLRTKLSELFPGLETQIMKVRRLSEGWDSVQTLVVYITHRNRSLINSPYYYNKNLLIHFTNGLALNSMLQEKVVRLYNLYNLNDPTEFTFASKVLKIDNSDIEEARSNIFVISFCEPEIIDDPTIGFNMWRLYGQNGRGIGIVFSIYNNPTDWMDFHISNVFYGNEGIEIFNNIQDLINELSRYLPDVQIDIGKLLPYHKSDLFSLEKEVRIIYDRRIKIPGTSSDLWYKQNEKLFPKIKSDVQKIIERKNNVRYLNIPIFQDNATSYLPEIPVLKIEKIIIGYNFQDEELSHMIQCISEMCNYHLGYLPEISYTLLRSSYLDL